MGRNRRSLRILAAAIVIVMAVLSCAAPAAAEPTSPLCEDGSYRAQHPLVCDTGASGPFTIAPGGGGTGNRGLLGGVLGGLTGGLL